MRIACRYFLLWGIFSSIFSTKTLLVTASEGSDDFEGYMEEPGDDSNTKSHGPHLHNTTWAIAATTPLEANPHTPFFVDRSKQAPYVHWTCFRQLESHAGADKLACCQHIYGLMEQEPATLCWKSFGCGMDQAESEYQRQKSRTEFMHFCTGEMVQLPFLSGERGFQPQWTLVLAPKGAPLDVAEWRQCMSFSGNKAAGDWHYMVQSPLELAVDPLTFYTSEKSESEQDDLPTFGANLTTIMGPSQDSDEERLLKHRLLLDVSLQKPDEYTAILDLIYIFPESSDLAGKNAFSKCQSSCGGTCEFTLVDQKPLFDFDSQTIHHIMMVYKGKKSNSCKLEWNTGVLLEDEDEEMLIPAPVVLEARLNVGDVAVAKWDRKQTFVDPLWTEAEGNGKDEL